MIHTIRSIVDVLGNVFMNRTKNTAVITISKCICHYSGLLKKISGTSGLLLIIQEWQHDESFECAQIPMYDCERIKEL